MKDLKIAISISIDAKEGLGSTQEWYTTDIVHETLGQDYYTVKETLEYLIPAALHATFGYIKEGEE